jgi:hypothetical protein
MSGLPVFLIDESINFNFSASRKENLHGLTPCETFRRTAACGEPSPSYGGRKESCAAQAKPAAASQSFFLIDESTKGLVALIAS